MKLVLFAAAFATALAPAAFAQEAPNFDARPGCQAGARSGLVAKPDTDACVRGELKARDHMVQQWAEFPAPDKQRCVAKTHMGGPPSYVEVLTCLELARDVRRMPKDDNTGLDSGLRR
ncbi:hypothetical protein GJW-30_1_03038 [Variibacter gotjawalensis]|uniref:Uncharacterized protein n=1 Tax=Variibacter gotjawalensis TaxID=1333996 RepID=A0A0S3PX61_9BRAD|nr:hypothetical protein [Variibacter gotjawalensis]NIK46324.1 hypothetical protein [Variibacter gotjawalensis]RZS48234.1 hypothetical protein EV661_0640 [Variibacter gotjawalensis]BAT60494.1 hypothetical protein GJW-30_1_03038 [Variibacter gotjawalensis]